MRHNRTTLRRRRGKASEAPPVTYAISFRKLFLKSGAGKRKMGDRFGGGGGILRISAFLPGNDYYPFCDERKLQQRNEESAQRGWKLSFYLLRVRKFPGEGEATIIMG